MAEDNRTYSSVKDSSHESKIEFEIVPTEFDSRPFHYIHLENNHYKNDCDFLQPSTYSCPVYCFLELTFRIFL